MIIISALFVLFDQLIKRIISISFSFGEEREIIGDFFRLTYTRNDGAAFGILGGHTLLLILVGVFAIGFIYFSFIKGKVLTKFEIVVFSILFGGILGNLIDRALLGYVIDYLSFNIFGYHFPTFNLADIGIVLSTMFILFLTVKEELECRKLKSKKM